MSWRKSAEEMFREWGEWNDELEFDELPDVLKPAHQVVMGATSKNMYDPLTEKEVTPEELVEWFVKYGWVQSKQELVDKLFKTYKVVKR